MLKHHFDKRQQKKRIVKIRRTSLPGPFKPRFETKYYYGVDLKLNRTFEKPMELSPFELDKVLSEQSSASVSNKIMLSR